jgi:RNA polymerase sigma-70 factor (ECF subfamily)
MSKRERTDMGGNGYVFLTTHWSLIEGIQTGDKEKVLIGRLIERYWKPVYCYLRRRGLDNEQAKDHTQGFFHDIVLNRNLVQRADQKKGRFRTFLLHAIDQYLTNEKSKEMALKRYPRGGLVPLDITETSELAEMNSSWTPEDCYNYAWLCELLEKVLSEVEAECQEDNLDIHWQIFKESLLEPTLTHTTPPSLAELSSKYSLDDPKKVSNMAITVKRRFQKMLRKHIRNSVSAEDEVTDEFEEILKYFP